jgi:hypothetical protein
MFLKYSQRKEHCKICNKDIQKNYFKKHCQTQAHLNRSAGLSREESDSGEAAIRFGSETESETESD